MRIENFESVINPEKKTKSISAICYLYELASGFLPLNKVFQDEWKNFILLNEFKNLSLEFSITPEEFDLIKELNNRLYSILRKEGKSIYKIKQKQITSFPISLKNGVLNKEFTPFVSGRSYLKTLFLRKEIKINEIDKYNVLGDLFWVNEFGDFPTSRDFNQNTISMNTNIRKWFDINSSITIKKIERISSIFNKITGNELKFLYPAHRPSSIERFVPISYKSDDKIIETETKYLSNKEQQILKRIYLLVKYNLEENSTIIFDGVNLANFQENFIKVLKEEYPKNKIIIES